MTARAWRVPLFISGLVLLSQAFPYPSPVRDAATLDWARGYHLVFPAWHLIFTPFCSIADLLTVLSVHEIKVLLVWLFIACLVAGWKRGTVMALVFTAFVGWAALVPRPMGQLISEDPEILLVDFHSHSQYSHDGRSSFTPQANMRWHLLQGYNAAFITDHNRVEAASIAKGLSRNNWRSTGYRSLSGEEVSLEKTHLVILGNPDRVDNRPFDGDFSKVPAFIAEMHKRGIPVIASLPEYWFYHWGEGIEDFARWGMDGFELINSAPKALDFPTSYRLQVVNLCRHHNLFMTGISDNHGYGYATAAWNAVRLPGWENLNPDELETALIKVLAVRRFDAVQVLERARFAPASILGLILSPAGIFWNYWRALQPIQCISWVFWIWLLYLPCRKSRLV